MNRRVSVWKYVKIGDRWRYCKPVYGANNKIKPHWVYVNGKPEELPDGNFYIHKLDHARQVWKKIGTNPADAVRAAEYEESLLSAIAAGLPIKKEATPDLYYGPQMWRFLEDYKLSQSDESYALMSQTLVEFNEQCKKNDLTKITREDLLRYKKWLVNRHRSLRTAGNLRQSEHSQRAKPRNAVGRVARVRFPARLGNLRRICGLAYLWLERITPGTQSPNVRCPPAAH
jgi:hypothetical protein